MRDIAAYLLYRASSALIAALPLALVFRLGQLAGAMAWLLLPQYRRLGLRNTGIAFRGEKSRAAQRAIVRRHFSRLTANILSGIKAGTMPLGEVEKRVSIANIEPMTEAFRSGVPVVLLLSHLSNWELFSQLMPKCFPFIRSSSIYQPLRNRRIDAHVRRIRSRTGLELFDRSQGFKPVLDLLRDGGGVGVLSDQHAGDHGIWTPLFGRLASTSSLAALLAKRAHAAVFSAAVQTTGVGRWRMVFSNRIDHPNESIEELTARGNAILEQQVRTAPEDWLWLHDRWKTPHPNFLLANYKRGVYLPPTMSAEQLQRFEILIRSSRWLGDAVMSVPAVRAIKRGRPDARLTVMSTPNLVPMWQLVSDVDEIVAVNTRSLISAVRALRKKHFDAAVLFPNSLRAVLEAWLAGVPRRVGYKGHRRSWLLNQVVREPSRPRPPEHQSRKYLRIAERLGADGIEDGFRSSFVLPPAGPSGGLAAINDQTPIRVALCPGAEYGPAKRWLPDRFAEAAASVSSQRDVQWVLLGTAADHEIGEIIAGTLGDKCVNKIGQTDLKQLIAELKSCRALLTNDTGTMHLAALVGLPTVAIFGSTEPALTGPLGTGHVILRHHVECSPCFLRRCPIDFRCMKSVAAAEAAQAVLSVLGHPLADTGNPVQP